MSPRKLRDAEERRPQAGRKAPPWRAGATTCDDAWCTLAMNPTTYVFNNLWNASACEGAQSITVHGPSAWATEYDWAQPHDWQVTTYAAAILGWHWGYLIPGDTTNMPVKLDDPDRRVLANLAFTMTPPDDASNRYDVAFDCWSQASATPTEQDPRFELMIWFAYSQDYLGVGADYLEMRPTIGDLRWKILPHCIRNADRSGQVDTVSFMIDGPNQWGCTDLDVTEFHRWVIANRQLFPASAMLDSLADWYLCGVEFGPEAYKGAGVLEVTRHEVRVVETSPITPGGLPPELRAEYAIMALSESVKQGNENVDQGVARAYELVDTIWAQRHNYR